MPERKTDRTSERTPDRAPEKKQLLMNVAESEEMRVALVVNGRLQEYQVEEQTEKTLHGSIYVGRVVNIEPGIQAAFVDIGAERSAFLHVSDVHHAYAGARGIPVERFQEKPPERGKQLIQNILRKGQEILVQVSKEAIGHKGPSVTTFVSLPGRYVVLMAGMSRAGVSKKIEDREQRAELRQAADALNPGKHMGVIVRTAGLGHAKKDLERDLRYLKQVWQGILKRLEEVRAPALLYEESGVVIRTIRDLFDPSIEEIVIDDAAVVDEVNDFIDRVMPKYTGRVRHYRGTSPIFWRHGVEKEIESIYDRKVPLESGGSLVIDEAEALVAIDVNSGRYRREDDLEKTAVMINVEAAEEIARQLRLRDIGGVIICDFIDMTDSKNCRKVEQALRSHLRHDRAKTWFSRMSRFGIIEMTRQRLRPSKDRVARETCPTCSGRGTIRSARSLSGTVLRQLRRGIVQRGVTEAKVYVGESTMDALVNDRREQVVDLERETGKRITIRPGRGFASDEYSIDYVEERPRGRGRAARGS